jgi:CRISPR-associated exonuclease Cas4
MVRTFWCSAGGCSVVIFSPGGGYIDLFVVGSVLFCVGVFFFLFSVWIRSAVKKEKKRVGVPEGSILYSDLNIQASPLFSKRSLLVGKPDYILQKNDRLIPVEVKSGKGQSPHQSHILQLAAYCQILEDTTKSFVSEGILVYNHVPYTIPFNPKLRFELETVTKTIRGYLRRGGVKRNHADPHRCRNCSMKRYCAFVVQENE